MQSVMDSSSSVSRLCQANPFESPACARARLTGVGEPQLYQSRSDKPGCVLVVRKLLCLCGCGDGAQRLVSDASCRRWGQAARGEEGRVRRDREV